MKTIYIGTNNKDVQLSNLQHGLPHCWQALGVEFRISELYAPSVVGSRIFKHCDLAVDFRGNDTRYPAGNSLMRCFDGWVLNITRHDKSYNSAWLNTIAERLGLQRFQKLETFDDYPSFVPSDGKLYIAKPEGGARSLSQIIFDPTQTTAAALHETLGRAGDDIIERIKALPGSPLFVRGYEEETGEATTVAKDSSYYFQEYVPNVTSEFRVIIGYDGKVGYCLQRDRKEEASYNGRVVATASGAHRSPLASSTVLQPQLKPFEAEIAAMLSQADFSLFAFDFFVTSDNRWGIFEFSPQSGISAVPNGFLARNARAYIERLVSSPALGLLA